MAKVIKYQVKYLDRDGKERKGVFLGSSPDLVRKDLEDEGCLVLKINRDFSLFFKTDSALVVAFLKNLTNLVESGFSVSASLEVLYQSERNTIFKSVVKDTLESINKGYTITESLALHPEWFN